jgi:hypothetical protein
MCDYSLYGIPNRLAVEGEQLTVYRFHTRSIGMACPADLRADDPSESRPKGLWPTIRNWFSTCVEKKTVPAVCIPNGARLLLRDIPEELQRELGVDAEEPVTFVQMGNAAYTYRDGIRFCNGREILLQRLSEGQRADVLCLALVEEPVRRERVNEWR